MKNNLLVMFLIGVNLLANECKVDEINEKYKKQSVAIMLDDNKSSEEIDNKMRNI